MKKYIDAEHLREAIEKIINSIESCPFIEAEFGAEMRREGKIQAYNKTLALIDSLQQEQPEVDLEREIDEHSEQMPMSEFTHEREAEEFIEWAKKEFRHFYELGLNARKEE